MLSYLYDTFGNSGHPIACIFTCLFKFLAIFYYLFLSIIISSSIINTIVIIIISSADFWVVKNISGRFPNNLINFRLLVGLRWWNEVKEDGTEEWKYESYDDNR